MALVAFCDAISVGEQRHQLVRGRGGVLDVSREQVELLGKLVEAVDRVENGP